MEKHKRIVRTLLGHSHVPVGLKCLASLLFYSQEPISLVIHDDGTLTEADHELLLSQLPNSSILPRTVADATVLARLSNYPNCLAYRQRHALALKLIDIALLESDDLVYCDSDVLFLRPFRGLFDSADNGCKAIFMADIQDAYSLQPWHVHPLGKVHIPQRLNSGLFFFRASAYDLDFVEWFLGHPSLQQIFDKRLHFVEQTCWAVLAQHVGCRLWNGQQLLIAHPAMKVSSETTIGIHFVASYRGKIDEFPDSRNQAASTSSAIALKTEKAFLSSSLQLLIHDIKRRYGHYWSFSG
jgi:hypothetical protein